MWCGSAWLGVASTYFLVGFSDREIDCLDVDSQVDSWSENAVGWDEVVVGGQAGAGTCPVTFEISS